MNKNISGSFTVGPETVRMLELGHPWILADTFTKRWQSGEPGDLVHISDAGGRFLATALLDPGQKIVGRVLSRERLGQIDERWLKARLRSAIDLRKTHLDLSDTTAFRLVNAEGDCLPGITVDRYADYLMIQLYSTAWTRHLKILASCLQELVQPAGIYEKVRPRDTRSLEQSGEGTRYSRIISGKEAPELLEVSEHGLKFLVSLNHGLHTGLFLDQRNNRRDLGTRCRGKRVLNLFSYTGSFSVVAAAAGASLVTSVDASTRYSARARDNFGINRLNPKRHEFIVGECLEAVRDLTNKGRRFDLIVMDPPSFSTSGENRFTTRRGTAGLISEVLPLLERGGLLVTSSNHQQVDIGEYLKEIRRGALMAGSDVRVVQIAGQSEDFPYSVCFPEGRYLKYVMSVKL